MSRPASIRSARRRPSSNTVREVHLARVRVGRDSHQHGHVEVLAEQIHLGRLHERARAKESVSWSVGRPTVGKKDAGRVQTPTCTMSQLACSPNTPDTTRDLGTSRTRATEVSHEHVSPMRSQHAFGDASTTPTDVKSAKYRRPLEPSSRRCGDDEGRCSPLRRKSVEPAKASCRGLGIGLSGCN